VGALPSPDGNQLISVRAFGANKEVDRPKSAQSGKYNRLVHGPSRNCQIQGVSLVPADILTVWKLDRLGRSLPHLIETVNALEARGVSFRSLTEAIDTTTLGGRLVYHIFGALGQFERDLIRERTRAGLDAATARGRQGGRKPVVTDEKLRRAQTLIIQGLTVREVAARVKVGKTALYAALARCPVSL